tara:strand:+ start:25442 stop:26317 length:876 start_codon:yes stop_codon:yes gene_type:complete
MKKTTLIVSLLIVFSFVSCNQEAAVNKQLASYSNTWDEIINKGNLDYFNEDNFTKDLIIHMEPENIVGIEATKAYYKNYLIGFSNIEFTIVDIFGQGDKIVKHWKFKGNHTGEFFGIPATGNAVDIEGTTLVKMKDGKIAEEQDFLDNYSLLQQLDILSDPNNISVIDALYQSFGKGDIPAVLGALDTNVVWNEAEGNEYADGNPYVGPDAVLNGVFARVGGDNEYFNLVDIQLHEMSNNQVLATLRYQAKVKKTGKIMDTQAAHFWTLKNGKVTAFQQYVDTKKLHDTNH